MGSDLLFDPEWLADTGPAERREMVMEIGASVARQALMGLTLAANPALWVMADKLSEPEASFRQGWAEMVRVSAEPYQWEALADSCRRRGFERHGDSAVLRSRAKALVNLSRKIDRELDRLANHPAYTRRALAGVHPLVLPGVRSGDRLAPTVGRLPRDARMDVEFGEMAPYAMRVRNRMFTSWRFLPSEHGGVGTLEGGGAGE